MCCELIERQLGRYLDEELPASQRTRVQSHLAQCASCRAELEELKELTKGISDAGSVNVPTSLWRGIERRLDQQNVRLQVAAQSPERPHVRSTRWVIAATVLLAVGLGMLGVRSLEPSAQASSVDFSALLDALPLNAQKAFRKFLIRYDAKPITPAAARRAAPRLSFATPSVLPCGFQLQSVYQIRIGNGKGIAAAYDRNGEFLAAIFHAPMKHERFGSHQSYPCVIGQHCGHRVQVGQWKLIHLTDPSTCHCLLSRLDEQTEIPEVITALAPTHKGSSLDRPR